MSQETISDAELLEKLILTLDESHLRDLLTLLGFDTPAGLAFAEKIAHYKEQNQGDLQEQFSSTNADKTQYSPLYTALLKFIDQKGLTEPYVYNAIGMIRTNWYYLRYNKNKKTGVSKKNSGTSKKNIIKIGLVLELDYWEFFYLVSLAGFSLVPLTDKTDRVVIQCIIEKEYDRLKIDERLISEGEEPMFTIY